jgi:hypothetical protein
MSEGIFLSLRFISSGILFPVALADFFYAFSLNFIPIKIQFMGELERTFLLVCIRSAIVVERVNQEAVSSHVSTINFSEICCSCVNFTEIVPG